MQIEYSVYQVIRIQTKWGTIDHLYVFRVCVRVYVCVRAQWQVPLHDRLLTIHWQTQEWVEVSLI